MRHDDAQVGKVDRDVVDVHRVRVLEADATAAADARADPCLSRMEDRRESEFLQHLIQRIRDAVVGVEALQAWVELEPSNAEVLEETPRITCPRLALRRVDTREGDEHV